MLSSSLHYLETSGFVAPRAAEPPLGREVQVVVLHHVVQALFEGAFGEVDVVIPVVVNWRELPSTMPVSRLTKYSPLCCLYNSRKVFCTATVSVGREREHAIAYFSVSSSSFSRGTTLLTKPQSYISLALNGRPVNSISENLRKPIVSAHHHRRGPQPT